MAGQQCTINCFTFYFDLFYSYDGMPKYIALKSLRREILYFVNSLLFENNFVQMFISTRVLGKGTYYNFCYKINKIISDYR